MKKNELILPDRYKELFDKPEKMKAFIFSGRCSGRNQAILNVLSYPNWVYTEELLESLSKQEMISFIKYLLYRFNIRNNRR